MISAQRFRTGVAAAALLLAAFGARAADRYFVRGERPNLRQGPGLQYAIVDRIEPGEAVEVLSTRGNWAEVRRTAGTRGWILRSFLAASPLLDAPVVATPGGFVGRPPEPEPAPPAPPPAATEPAPPAPKVAKKEEKKPEPAPAPKAAKKEKKPEPAPAPKVAKKEEKKPAEKGERGPASVATAPGPLSAPRRAPAPSAGAGERPAGASRATRKEEPAEIELTQPAVPPAGEPAAPAAAAPAPPPVASAAEKPAAPKREETRPPPAAKAGKRKKEQAAQGPGGPPGPASYEPHSIASEAAETVRDLYEKQPVEAPILQPEPETPAPPAAAPKRPVPPPPPPRRPAEPGALARYTPSVPPKKGLEMSTPRRGLVLEEIVARVGEEIITRSDLLEREAVARQISGAAPGAPAPPTTADILQRMIEERLLMQQARLLGVDQDKVYQKGKEKFMERNRLTTDMELIDQLGRSGMSLEEFRDVILRNYLPEIVIEREVREKIEIPDEEVAAYYDGHRAEFDVPERVKLQEILVSSEGRTESALRARFLEVMTASEQGIAFEDLARRFSDAPSRVQGGDIGWVARGQLDPRMEELAFSLLEGEMRALRVEYGYHLLRLEARDEAHQQGLEEASPEIRRLLAEGRFRDEMQKYLDQLRASWYVEVQERYLPD